MMDMMKQVTAALFVGCLILSKSMAATVAYWPFDEQSGDLVDVIASDGAAQTLTGHEGVKYAQEKVAPGQILNPDAGPFASGSPANNAGSIDFGAVTVAPHTRDAARFQITERNSFTLEGWFQHSIGDGTQKGLEYIAGDQHAMSNWAGWNVALQDGIIKLSYYVNSSGKDARHAAAKTRVDDGKPHHFAAVWDHQRKVLRFYLDGVLQSTSEEFTPQKYKQHGFSVGARNRNTDGKFDDDAFKGRLDEMRFSNAVLYPSHFLLGKDAQPPQLVDVAPADDRGDVAVFPLQLVATFQEPIQLKAGGELSIIDLTDGSSSQVIQLPDERVQVIDQTTLRIDLKSKLERSTDYAIRISPGALEDLAQSRNAFAGIADDTTWNFKTVPPDTTGPSVAALSPADDSTSGLPWGKVRMTFDEPITLKEKGTITLKDLDDGSSTIAITLPDPRVTVTDEKTVTVDLFASELEWGKNYAVQVAKNAIDDQADTPNAFAGIADDTSWNFRVKPKPDRVANVLIVTTEFADAKPSRTAEEIEGMLFHDEINVDDALREASYGQLGLRLGDGSGKDATLEKVYPDIPVAKSGGGGGMKRKLMEDLQTNYDFKNIRFHVFIWPKEFPGNAAGAATVGGVFCSFKSPSVGVIMHEFGHLLGGNHSFQHPGCSLGWHGYNFSAGKKLRFGWMDKFPGTVTTLEKSSTVSLVPLSDHPDEVPGLRIVKVPGEGGTWHITYRVSKGIYSSLRSPEAWSNKVMIVFDSGSALSHRKGALKAGEVFEHASLKVTCEGISEDGQSAKVRIEIPNQPKVASRDINLN